MNRPSEILKITLIIFLTFLAYIPSLNGGFIWDDDSHVLENPSLISIDGLKQIWINPGATPQYYPLVFTVFWVGYQIWEYNPVGYHTVNVVLHIINSVLVFVILKKLNVKWFFFSAFVFGIHPVLVESVAWITELKNVLSGFFYLLALLLYLKSLPSNTYEHSTTKNSFFYLLALFCYIFSLFSKTITCSLPVTILLIIWWKKNKIQRADIYGVMPFLLIGGAMGLLTIWMEKTHVGAQGAEWNLSIIDRVLIAGRALWFYAGKILFPVNLCFMYPKWNINSESFFPYIYPISVLMVIAFFWFFRHKLGKGPITCLLYFTFTLFPALGFIDVYPMRYTFVADHYQYLGSLGIIVLIPALAKIKYFEEIKSKHLTVLSASVICLFFAITWSQGKIYKDKMSLYVHILSKNPNSWMAYNNKGILLMENNKIDHAIHDFTKALKFKSDYVEAYYNRGVAYGMKGQNYLAFLDYDKLLTFDPSHFKALVSRGSYYFKKGKIKLAFTDLNLSIESNPNYDKAYNERGILYGVNEKYDHAIQDFNNAILINPHNKLYYYNRSLIYIYKSDYKKSLNDVLISISKGQEVEKEHIDWLKNKIMEKEKDNDLQ